MPGLRKRECTRRNVGGSRPSVELPGMLKGIGEGKWPGDFAEYSAGTMYKAGLVFQDRLSGDRAFAIKDELYPAIP